MAQELLKIGQLAKKAGIPVATAKHWVREGLIHPVRRGRNIAYFDPSTLARIERIQELKRQFLPLHVIRDVVEEKAEAPLASLERSIRHTLEVERGKERRTSEELVKAGVAPADLAWLKSAGALSPMKEGDTEVYGGDDLELLRTLGAARRAGLTPAMLPLEIVAQYVEAVRALVRVELTLFREGVLPRAPDQVMELAEKATQLSEKLFVLLRRKLLLPTLHDLAAKRRAPIPRNRPRLTRRPKSRK